MALLKPHNEKKPGRLKRLAQKFMGRNVKVVEAADDSVEARMEKANRGQGTLQEAVREYALAQYIQKLVRYGSRGRARRVEAAEQRRKLRRAKRAKRRAERRPSVQRPIRLKARTQLDRWGRSTLRKQKRRAARTRARASRRANRAA